MKFDKKEKKPCSEEMFRQADIALYYVKDHGRDGCCFYSDALKEKTKPHHNT